ncbi:MAG: hypothetical protein ACTHOB_18390 [Ginsengibacter sp.]
MTTLSSNLAFKLKALGIYQLIFAVAGLGGTLWLFLQEGFQSLQLTIIFLVVILVFLFAIYCGISCFQMKEKCLWYSSINQYLQLISFSITGYGFMYDSGLSVNLGIDLTTNFAIGLKMLIFSFWHIDYNSGSDVILVNLNLVALAVILIIDRMKKQMKHEIEEELLTIGQEMEK